MGETTAEHWMRLALQQAERARAVGEVPVGAVIVADDRLLADGYNRTITDTDPTAHAEIVAIRQAARRIGNYRLTDCDLYVTLEPCIMCLGACVQARIRRLFFGTPDPRWGCLGSRLDLRAPELFNHTIEFSGGILADECRALLQDFFQQRRHS
ncbi:MAG: tRNA adenosine(34) deaminase TadA [Acidobacteria bacterium]|nr:tRNA adenosine(34) deaminase TadA [Acidobacteriota bacterium]